MCRASDDHRAIDFPEWRGSGLQGRFKDLRWQLLATDGGTTATLLDYQLPRLEQLKLRPSVVTLTDGGNDVLSCYGDTQAALEPIATVRQRVGTALDVLRTLTQPLARVVVGTVYDPSDGTGDAATVGLPPWPADRDLWYCNIKSSPTPGALTAYVEDFPSSRPDRSAPTRWWSAARQVSWSRSRTQTR